MRLRIFVSSGSVSCLFLIAAASAAHAQIVSATMVLAGPVVVSTTRTERNADDQATPVWILSRDRIEARMLGTPGNIVTLFNEIPGLRVQIVSPLLGTSTIRIQGLPGRYTRLLADSVHVFGDRPGGYPLLRVPPMHLDRVEVIKGPANAWFGSDAVAGVVNLISRKPGTQPVREVLFSQSSRNATDGVLWLSTPALGPNRTWSSTFLASVHRQEETDIDDDGWSDIPGHQLGVLRPHVFWHNKRGKSIAGFAGVTIETRDGGSAHIRESLETKTADGGLSGQLLMSNGNVLSAAGVLFVQSRTRDFSDARERDRLQTAVWEMSLRRTTERNTWVGGLSVDWYAVRSVDALPSTYVSTRGGLFFQDDVTVAPWLVLSGVVRIDHHNLYNLLVSPRGAALVRGGNWSARFSASQGYFTPRFYNEETEAAGIRRLTVEGPLEKETARSFSGDLTHKTPNTAFTITVFRTQIDDPAQVDRTTYTQRTESDPIVARGAEIFAAVRRAPFSVIGTYAFVKTRERDGRELALTPRRTASLIASVAGNRGRISVDVAYTGRQRLDNNPFRSISERYVLVGLLGEYRLGRYGLFVNADNLTDIRQTDWDPLVRPTRDVDGRWTVDQWAPLRGRVINGGLRVSF